MTSGSMSYCSKANQVPVRPQPVCTSSTTSGMPSSRVSLAHPPHELGSAGTTPPSPCTISMITAAGSAMPPLRVPQRPLQEARRSWSRRCRGRSAERAVGAVGEREEVHARHAVARPAPWSPRSPVIAIAAWRAAVEAALEGDDVAAAGRGLAQLDRGVDGVGAGRAAEVHLASGPASRRAASTAARSVNASLAGEGRSSPWQNTPELLGRRRHQLGVVVAQRQHARHRPGSR